MIGAVVRVIPVIIYSAVDISGIVGKNRLYCKKNNSMIVLLQLNYSLGLKKLALLLCSITSFNNYILLNAI